jgi:hypothetical protein
MLGNFSFGDYFKDVAIELAWNLVTKVYGLPKDKLTATVFSEDDDAFNLWKKIAGLPESRIIRIPTSDNFWAMGDTGPCGPCSEIFFDHGPTIAGGPPGSADQDGDRFIEIWNLVFMQFQAGPGPAWRSRGPRSTAAWASSISPPCSRQATTTTSTSCALIEGSAGPRTPCRRPARRVAPRHRRPPATSF